MTQQGHFSFFSAGSDYDLRADRLGIWLIGLQPGESSSASK
jgi:hypothetical protein